MRYLLLLCPALILCGCFGKPKAGQETGSFNPVTGSATGEKNGNQKFLVTSANALVGKVVLVNTTGRFVVLNFPVGHLPAMDQHLNLYRGGVKVGEVKVTGPQYDDNIVGDLLAGESEIGDQVRDK